MLYMYYSFQSHEWPWSKLWWGVETAEEINSVSILKSKKPLFFQIFIIWSIISTLIVQRGNNPVHIVYFCVLARMKCSHLPINNLSHRLDNASGYEWQIGHFIIGWSKWRKTTLGTLFWQIPGIPNFYRQQQYVHAKVSPCFCNLERFAQYDDWIL